MHADARLCREDEVAVMPRARAVEEARWAETMVLYIKARAGLKEEKDALMPPQAQPRDLSFEQQVRAPRPWSRPP